jgi:hypothetical protein
MMMERLKETDWMLLLGRIREGKCTPFLGAGACYGTLPLGSKIAEDWARKEEFPFEDCADLVKVAQFLSIKYDAIHPKDRLIEQFRNIAPPDFTEPFEPHRVLADLPLPIYITTNYDDFLFRALSQTKYGNENKKPVREVCKWNQQLRERAGTRHRRGKLSGRLEGNVETPIIFHLHGHTQQAESMVLTEDDYLDFLINLARDDDLLPPRIQEAFASTSLLFVGYSLNDWNFRVLFRSVVGYLEKSLQRAHISVQLAPVKTNASEDERRNAEDYLNRYFDNLNIRVYWGTAREFARELREHWDAFCKAGQNGN